MSLACMGGGITLLLMGDTTAKGVGVTLITTVSAFWFLAGAKNQGTTITTTTQQTTTPANINSPVV